ncbi:YaaC family protein [Cobetia marina]|uniref:YaaC family protein n=1 Tax=Cobetia marina TaxID=28258 RepID=UPI001144C5C6|nr:YaaC family protein [Cobetia marina]GED43206.1 hypothetical protein HHA02_25350 [Cobetia marina]
MTRIEDKYGFPLFSKPVSIVNLGKNEKLIISDIWSFWDYVIKKVKNDKKGTGFLQSLLEQAKHFYQTAEDSPVKSQPLLYYCSFLNLAKIMINLNGKFGEDKIYMHGMSERNNKKFIDSVIIKQKKKEGVVQVAHELVSLFDPYVSESKLELNAKCMLNHCVGVHRAYSEIYNQHEIFVRVKSSSLFKHGKSIIFFAELQCTKQQMEFLNNIGYSVTVDDSGKCIYKESITISGQRPNRKEYASLSERIKEKGVWYYIGNSGYTLYLSTCSEHRYTQESIIYMMMFYLGSITRYHPYMFDRIFSDKEQWLMSEFLNTQPKQFLYLATANILGQSVLKSYSSF